MAKASGGRDIFKTSTYVAHNKKLWHQVPKKSWALSGFAPDCISMCVKITDE